MAKFRKKPVVIEARQFLGDENAKDILDWIHLTDNMATYHFKEGQALMLFTLEGWIQASPKDWVIKGVKGEFYPCKPDIFEMTYELLEE